MLLFIPIIIGVVIGPLMAVLFHRKQYIAHNVILGIVGAISLRLVAYAVMAVKPGADTGSIPVAVLSSLVGALLLTYIFKLFPPLGASDEE